MASIPFSDKDMTFTDEQTGALYDLAQPTDEIEVALLNFETSFEPDIKKRFELFSSNEAKYREWINGHVNILLRGWRGLPQLPEFPASNPAAQMRGELKERILAWWNSQVHFTRDDLKK